MHGVGEDSFIRVPSFQSLWRLLVAAAVVAGLTIDTRPSAAGPADHSIYIKEAATRFCVPELWIEAVMRRESAGNHKSTSPKGAMSLMQIMPETWAGLRRRHALGSNPYHPRDNILAGAAYMRELYNQFGAPNFLAAYNLGPVRLARDLRAKRPLPSETRHYLRKLLPVVQENPPPPCIEDAEEDE